MDYGRTDMVNGNYMEEKQPRIHEDMSFSSKWRRNAGYAEELRMAMRLEEERRTAVMRGITSFSDGPAQAPCLLHSGCIKMHRGSPTPFSSQELYSLLACVPEGQGLGMLKKTHQVAEHAPAGRIRFQTIWSIKFH